MNDKFTGLLGDPMLQIGLGILANNTGNRGAFAPAFGRGVMQGMNNAQEFAQQQQLLGFRNQQADMQKQQMELQKQAAEREKQQFDLQEQAIQDASENNPKLAGLFRLNPAAAIKATFPNANGADPYYTPIATENGLGTFNNRTGQFTPLNVNGQPIIKSTDSPTLQGKISASKSYGENLYQPTDMQSGVIKNKSQLAIDAGAPMPSGFPSVSPNVQAQRDLTRYKILLAEQQAAGGRGKNPELDKEINNMKMRGYGVSVPTKAEEAGAVEQAKVLAKAQGEAALELPKVINQGEQTIKLVDDLVNSKGFETAVGLSSKLDPRNYLAGTDATDFKIRLDQLKGQQFLQAFESLKGGGQITEVEGKKATDAISRMNTAQSEEEFKAAANEFKGVIKQGVDRAKQKAGGAPKSGATFNELPPPNKYKGKIIRNPDTGKRMQSDGMRWKAL